MLTCMSRKWREICLSDIVRLSVLFFFCSIFIALNGLCPMLHITNNSQLFGGPHGF